MSAISSVGSLNPLLHSAPPPKPAAQAPSADSTSVTTNADGSITTTVTDSRGDIVSASTTPGAASQGSLGASAPGISLVA